MAKGKPVSKKSTPKPKAAPKKAAAKKVTAKKAAPKKAAPKKAAAKKVVAKKAAPKKAVAKKAAPKKAVAKKVAPKKAVAKKAAPKKVVAKKAAPKKAAKVARKTYHVVPLEKGGWAVKLEGAKNPSGRFDKKTEAIARGKELAKKPQLGALKVHKQDGKIQTEYTYGDDPKRSKG